ncbi:MAG: WHG domain-containing protein [Alphaproteobacteria bacterium]|nr:WHG domain-containing protein [Alphaproteobacteria bacterium]
MPRGVGLSRERVLDLAEALVDAQGPEALTATALAAAAGVRTPSLYKHVDGLPDVVAGLRARLFARLAALMATGDGAEADLLTLAEAWREEGLRHPGVYALGARTHVGDAPEVVANAEVLLAEVWRRVRAAGVAEADVVHAARSFRALVHGMVMLEVSGGFGLEAEVGESFRAGVRALVAGWRRG